MTRAVIENGITKAILHLNKHHFQNSQEYRRLFSSDYDVLSPASNLEGLYPLPAAVFKWLELKSVPPSKIVRVMKSSGTRGRPSSIALDAETAKRQEKEFTRAFTRVFGTERRPMLLMDSRELLNGSSRESARAAATIATMRFGIKHFWLIEDSGVPNYRGLSEWLHEQPEGQEILVFGFTYIAWGLLADPKIARILSNTKALFIHGGGWKKLEDSAFNRQDFQHLARAAFRQARVHDYYGMIEQLGSTWFEGEDGVLLAPESGGALIRDVSSLELLDVGQWGLVQVFSTIPSSYPGHSILTDDLGRVVANSYFPEVFGSLGLEIRGRLPKVEVRGCSDAI